MATPGRRRSAPPTTSGRGDDVSPVRNSGEQTTPATAVDGTVQSQEPTHPSRISYDELLKRFGRPGA